MNIEGRFENKSDAERRIAPRRTLLLGAEGRFGADRTDYVTIHNLSASGLLIETETELSQGDRFWVELPEGGEREAHIVWADAPHYGCQFVDEIGPAVLAAALLRGEQPDAPPTPGMGETFGDRLRRLRQERGLSLGEIAARLGVSKPTVWAWEHGKSRPVDRRLTGLAEVLGVTVGGLEPGPADSPEVIDSSRQRIAQAYGVDPSRVRILIEL